MITLAGSAIDANPSISISTDRFATSTGISAGFNVTKSGAATANAWTFTKAYGNFAGEAFDNDGGTACGNIRWDDSACLFVSEAHYEWRNDDGGEGALASSWFNASWSARKMIVVSNPNTNPYTNYPLKIAVTYASSMRSDFGDLRFTDSSGTTSIPYYIESTNPSASSTVWVRIPSLAGSGSATIYMYYGNASATTTASGGSTFAFYEDFETNSLAGYSGTGPDLALFTTGTSFAHNGTYGLNTTNVSGKTSFGIYRTGSLLTTGETLQYYQYVDTSQADEPCTLFGVQAASQNYAVCLEEYPTSLPAGLPHISLAKDVINDDLSGTVLATSTVTYTTGWYQVVIDWLTSHVINVNVYNSAGALFGSVSASNSAYSGGGMGFTYWFQKGGWDFYTARPYATTTPTYLVAPEQADNGATWRSGQDTVLTGASGASTGQNIRLRFSIQNTGPSIFNQQYLLQVAPLNALNCESVTSGYTTVQPQASCGSAVACMTSSSQFSNMASTSPSLSFPASMNFAAGEILQDPFNETGSSSVPTNSATEVEYNFQFTGNATANTYCLRATNNGAALDNYSHVASVTILHAPQLSNISFNGASNIALTGGATTTISVTATATDNNGYTDMSFATSTMYRSGVGASCTANQANCYQISTSSCVFSSCSGVSCTLTCSADLEYFADPTDASSTFPTQAWLATIAVQDSTGLRDTETSASTTLQTLDSLSISTPSVNFGSLAPGSDTGTTNATTTIVNTGNAPINIQLYGTDLNNIASTTPIGVGQQKFATSTFQYASCSLCQVLAGSATPKNVNVEIPKPTSTASSSQSNLYFGLNVPTGIGANNYTGTNTFIAVPG